MRPQVLAGALVSAALALAAVPGHAAVTDFTWNPSGANPALSGAEFTADNMLLANSATISIAPSGNFTEHAYELITAFQLNGSTFTPSGYGTNYSLFFDINGMGTQNPAVPPVGSTSTGDFTSLNYTLYAAPVALSTLTPTFDASHNVSLSAPGEFALATGTLDTSLLNPVTFTRTATNTGVPTATANVSMLPVAGEGGFFAAPPDYSLVIAQGNFSTTPTNVQFYPGTPAILTIGEVGTAGGGNVNLTTTTVPVPEPASLALFGVGLLSLGFLKRRRA